MLQNASLLNNTTCFWRTRSLDTITPGPWSDTLWFSIKIYDFDLDQDVDVLDIMQVVSRWNSFSGDFIYQKKYDLNLHGRIDVIDIQLVATQWGVRY